MVDGLNMFVLLNTYILKTYTKKKNRMGINDFEVFFTKVKKVMDSVDDFCSIIESENLKNINSGEDNGEIEQFVQQIQNTCTYKGDTTKECTSFRSILISQLFINCTFQGK